MLNAVCVVGAVGDRETASTDGAEFEMDTLASPCGPVVAPSEGVARTLQI